MSKAQSKYLTDKGEISVDHLLKMGLTETEVRQVFCSENHTQDPCPKCGKPKTGKAAA